MTAAPALAACPGCLTAPAAPAARNDDVAGAARTILLSLPEIHCAGCIAGVERALRSVPGVAEARVNLSQKRAFARAAVGLDADTLIAALDRSGYAARRLDEAALAGTDADPAGRALLTGLGVAGFAMMNVMLLSVAVWSGAEAATRDLLHWISAAIALPAIAFSARPFFLGAWGALRHGRLVMDTPIAAAILLASAMSLYETAAGGAHAYFDAALSLTFFLLLGRYLDHRTRAAARSAARELTALEAPRAIRIEDGADIEVAADALKPGDLLRLAPGMRAPADAVVVEGASDTDRSHLTGESAPVAVGAGAELAAGELNLTGSLVLRATATGEATSLRRMVDMVAAAEAGRAKYASLADRAARIYAPGVHLLALIAGLGWLAATGDVRFSLNVAVAVLIITCPCALGLAAPAVATAAAGKLFRRGVLLKSGDALERLAEVDMVVFDKTGTLTTGEPRLAGAPDRAAFAAAAALAAGSAHPYARAIVRASASNSASNSNSGAGIAATGATDIVEVPGAGIEGVIDGRRARLGAASWIGAEDQTGNATWLQVEGEAPVRFGFEDVWRDGAADLIGALRAKGIDMLLLSGDGPQAVAAAAEALGLETAEARVTPAAKQARIEALTAAGRRVLMIGDGLNDAGALAAAHVSAAPGSGLDAARVAADIVFLRDDLAAIGAAFETARSAKSRIVENFAIAAIYNLIAAPVALAGFATPLIAAIAMSTSSITVSLNAARAGR